MNLTLWLSGSVEVRAAADSRVRLLNLCLQNGVPYRNFCYTEDGGISFRTPYLTAKRLQKKARSEGFSVTLGAARGIPAGLYHARRRVGLLLGGFVAICLLILSGRFVWDIEITGNTQMTAGEIRALLRACDFEVGSYIPSVQTRELENRILIASPEISWVAVNLSGTVARVQVIERQTPSVKPDLSKPANLVAACDGQIEFLQLYRGDAVVKVGQAVKKGELLVSGIYDDRDGGFRYTRAAGEVLARTSHTYQVKIPFRYEEKLPTEPICRSVSLNFFQFSMEIFKNTGNQGKDCDIIKDDTQLKLLGSRLLPIRITVTREQPYTVKTLERTRNEALELAYKTLEKDLASLSARAELLQKSIRTEWREDGVILVCTVEVIENIAVQSEFEIIVQE